MSMGNRIWQTAGVMALAALVSTGALGQVSARFVLPGGALTSTKITPGSAATFEVRVDAPAPALNTVGTLYEVTQSAPAAPPGFFTITGRVDIGTSTNPPYVYDDTNSGLANATVLALPSAFLNPTNGSNLGRTSINLVTGVPPASNILATTLTLTSDPATPLNTYTISAVAGSVISTTDGMGGGTDFPMVASFSIIVGQTLSVTKSGTGTGTVTSNIGLINCGAVCSDIYPGSVVTLTATPTAGSTFVGWTGGGCAGVGTCMVTVNAAKTVNAQFDLAPQTLTVTEAGTGAGTVTSIPAGISCPGTCSFAFPANQVVALTQTATAPATFAGWSGACAGLGACSVTMSAARAVTATFNLPGFNLTVTKSGTGAGTVTSAPAGINCGVTCTASFTAGTMVTLTAAATAGSNFVTFSGGGCTVSPCVVTVNAATSVNAQFNLGPQTLTVTNAGTGTGTVTSVPAGIACPGTCSFAFPASSTVTLTALATAGSNFTGFAGGGCAGPSPCNVLMSAAQNVTATFSLPPVTTITGGPTNPSGVASPQFTFTSSIAGSTFQCQLDAGLKFACVSPTTVTVGNGPHTFTVQAFGPGNNPGNVASFAWTAQGIIALTPIPALSEWALGFLALMLGGLGFVALRRRGL